MNRGTAIDQTSEYQELKLDSWDEEMMLLAHIVQDPKLAKRVCQKVDTESMFRTDCVPTIFNELIKVSSIFDGYMTRNDILSTIRPILSKYPTAVDDFTSAIKEACTDTRDGAYYIRRVVDRAGRRSIFQDMQPRQVLAQTYTVDEAIGVLRESMLSIVKRFSIATGRGGLLKSDFHENLQRLHERLDPENRTHLTFGYPRFDSMIKIETSSYNIIGARPSVGKTATSINLALKLAERGIRVMFVTLEVGYDKILELMACRLDGLRKSLVHNAASQNTRSRLSNAFAKLHDLPIELHCNCADVNQIITICEDAITREENPVEAIFIDYAQIIRTRQRNITDLQKLNIISDAFRVLKSDHKIALFLAAQLNRKTTPGAPRLEDLKGSGDFEQDADTVLLLDRPNKEMAEKEQATPGMEQTIEDDQLDIYIRKNRFGGTGKISFHWDGQLGKIEEMNIDENNNTPRKRDDDKRSHDYKTPDYKQRSYSDGSMDSNENEMPF